MFNGSSHIIIQGGTFIVVNGGIDSASLEAMGMNSIYPTCDPEGNHHHGRMHPNFRASDGQVPATTTEQFSLETNAQQFIIEPEVDPSFGSHSVMSFATPVYGSGQEPEYDPYFMPVPPPTPSITLESWDQITSTPMSVMSVGVRGNADLSSNDSHAAPSSFLTSNYYSTKPQYAKHPKKLRKRRHRTLPQLEHFQVEAWPTSSHHPIRAPTYPFTTPYPPFPVPQSICGAHSF